MNIWEGGKRRKGNKPQETLNNGEQTEGRWRKVGRRWARWVMGIKDGTCDKHCVFYVSDESLKYIPETKFTIYFN